MLNGSRSLPQLLRRLRRIDVGGDRVVLLLAAEVVVEAVDEEVEADDLERRHGVVDRLGRHLARCAEAGARRRRAGRRGARRVAGGATAHRRLRQRSALLAPTATAKAKAKRTARRRTGRVASERVMGVREAVADRHQPSGKRCADAARAARRGVLLRADDHLLTCASAVSAAARRSGVGAPKRARERARARSASISRSRGSAFVTSDPIRPRAASATSRHGLLERRLVGLRRHGEAAQLANELERGVADLELGGGRLEVEEGLDVSAHGDRDGLGPGRQDSGGQLRRAASARRRMQRDPIAFAVDDDRAVAVRADRVRRLHDAAAVRRRPRARRRRCGRRR